MSHFHGGNIFTFAYDNQIEPSEVIDYSANINPLGPSTKGMAALENRLRYISHYPDVTNDDVLNAVADVYGVEKSHILLGNGAAELIYAIGRLPGYTGAFVPAPGFSEYRLSMDAAKIPTRDIYYRLREEDGTPYFEIPYLALQTFAAELKGQDGRIIVFLGNPNNPDGTLLNHEYVRQLLSMLKEANSLLVIDESFIDFIGQDTVRDNSNSLRNLIHEFDNLLIVHSFTKFYAVPGLRVGAIFGSEQIIQELSDFIPAWTLNTLAQAYITAAVNDTEYIRDSKQLLEEEKKFVYQSINEITGLQAIQPSANFMLVQIQNNSITTPILQDMLTKHNIIIRNCNTYSGLDEHWFRMAIKDHETNEKLVNILQTIFNT